MNTSTLPLFPTPKVQGVASGAFAAAAAVAPLRGTRLDVQDLPSPPQSARTRRPQ